MISVIIPCYNCENTLKRAINSIINQSFGFEKIELILYDDSSNDNTKFIIEEYSKQYENIIPIFSKNNSGFPGKGRNEGIKKATSDYIMFLDNDDEYDKDMCKTLFNEITSQESDLVACNFLNIYPNKQIKSHFDYYYGEEKENKVIFYGENTIYLLHRVVWGCIFNKKIILENNIKFPEDKLSEDVYFLSIYNIYSNKSIFLKDYIGIYRYIQNESHSNSLTLDKINNQFDVFEIILNIYNEKEMDIDKPLIFSDILNIILYNLYHTKSIKNSKQLVYPFLERFRKFELQINFKNTKDPILNIAHKLILKRHYYLAKKYLTFLSYIEQSEFIKSIYTFLRR